MKVSEVDHKKARSVRCNYCGSLPNEPCRTSWGGALQYSHADRRARWLEQDNEGGSSE